VILGLTAQQWLIGGGAALLVGFSKTGLPGSGMLVVPLMAAVFGGRISVGTTLPMLIFGDCFAVASYRTHCRWDKLWELIPWVAGGMIAGGVVLWALGEQTSSRDLLNILIGALVLTMLAIHLIRLRLGERMVPSSRLGVVSTGGAAGFATTVSNAAGSIMQVYLTGMGLPKEQFMGTIAWYFMIFNCTKVPIYLLITHLQPTKPMMTAGSFGFDLAVLPVIALGALLGRVFLPRIPQKAFDTLVLVLSGLAAVKLMLG